ncbi:MAG: integrase arm-type DNA-binding domain-containing protein [Pseudomonadota bacterium]|nr:integrase arm-type DNA-binding domain-containing protein [Pseudomonadota bacterium]
MPLSESICKTAQCPYDKKGKKYWDGDGLYLYVSRAGGKVWRVDYRRHGKPHTLTLGAWTPDGMSLSDARKAVARIRARMALEPDYDPAPAKARARAEAAAQAQEQKARQETLADVAEKFALEKVRLDLWDPMDDGLRKLWLSGRPLPKGRKTPQSTEHRNRDRMRRHIFPVIGDMRMEDVKPEHLAKVVNRVRAGNERKKVEELLRGIVRYWLARQPLGTPDPSAYVNQLKKLPEHVKGHHAAIIDPVLFGSMVRTVRDSQRPFSISYVHSLFMCQVYLFQRIGALRQMRWTDVDFDRRVWRSPVEKMKASRRVKEQAAKEGAYYPIPLPSQVIELLSSLKPLATSNYVFESHSDDGYLSNGAVRSLLIREGFDKAQTAHGLRASAETILKNHFLVNESMIRRQMAHDSLRHLGGAYDRADLFAQRRMLVQTWADLVDWLCDGKSVLDFEPKYPSVVAKIPEISAEDI